MSLKSRAPDEYVQVDDHPWAPFPAHLCTGSVKWRLLNVSPEAGTWTAIFDCKAGSSMAPHKHTGPGQYFIYEGRFEVRGGAAAGGDTAIAPGYGFEAAGAQHDKTFFPVDSKFYMTFSGPVAYLGADGGITALVGWAEVQEAWQGFISAQ